jgi:hypothetical protein
MENQPQITIVVQPAPPAPAPPSNRPVLVAVIGAAALVLATLLAGVFGLLGNLVPIIHQHWKP